MVLGDEGMEERGLYLSVRRGRLSENRRNRQVKRRRNQQSIGIHNVEEFRGRENTEYL